MIKIREYSFTDRYKFQKLVENSCSEKKKDPPDQQKIIDTVGFYTSFPQCGKIFVILYNNKIVGYSIVQYIWKMNHGKISFIIDELFIEKNYRKYNPEINFVEFLIKQGKISDIEIKLDKLRPGSKKIFKFFKFYKDKLPLFVKEMDEG